MHAFDHTMDNSPPAVQTALRLQCPGHRPLGHIVVSPTKTISMVARSMI